MPFYLLDTIPKHLKGFFDEQKAAGPKNLKIYNSSGRVITIIDGVSCPKSSGLQTVSICVADATLSYTAVSYKQNRVSNLRHLDSSMVKQSHV
jgi:hypothetical protein